MPTFSYTTLGVQAPASTVEAADRSEAIRALRQRGVIPVQVELVERRAASRSDAAPASNTQSNGAPPPRRDQLSALAPSTGARPRVSRAELLVFMRELSTALRAGLPLVQALRTIRRQARRAALQAMLDHVMDAVEHGRPLSDAVEDWGPPFSQLVISLLRAGEASGRLPEVMQQAVILLEKAQRVRRSILSGLLYPAILLGVIAVAIIVVVQVIVPKLLEPLAGQMAVSELPLPTRALLAATDFIGAYWWIILGVILIAVFALRRALSDPAQRLAIHRFLLRVPVIGPLLRDTAVARFARTFSTLIAAGLPALTALRITKDTLGNAALADAMDRVCDEVSSGAPIAKPLEATGYFPGLLVQVVDLGERSGRLPETLAHAAEVFEERTEQSVEVFKIVIPPILIIVAAIIVGFVVAAVLFALLSAQEMIG